MHIVISPGDDLPIYRQLMRQVVEAIAGGVLAAGEKLPSHRELAEQLVIAPLTVKKAYDELEAQGFIDTQRGRGTFVCARLPRRVTGDHRAQLAEAAATLVTRALLSGLDVDDVHALISDAAESITDTAARKRRQGRVRK